MFGKTCSLIGMIHLQALPGAAGFSGDMAQIVSSALSDAAKYQEAGFDALLVENTHDTPYLKGAVEPETTAAITVVCQALRRETSLPLGIQVLAGANMEALGVAVACGLEFVRVEGFVYAHVADEGIHEACAPKLVRKRFALNSDRIMIFADIKKKHSSHAITSDISIAETAKDAHYCRADGVIVTGMRTGDAPGIDELKSVRRAVPIKVLIGSGVTPENLAAYARYSDGLIIGSSAKIDSDWTKDVDLERAKRLTDAAKTAK